jgi:uncharacterized protein YndB with AHSA1/START domain
MKCLLIVAALGLSLNARAATVRLNADFADVAPERLYQIYLDSKEHSEFTLGDETSAVINPVEGGSFAAFWNVPIAGVYGITGQILMLVPGKVIVQTWRGAHDDPSDPTSNLTLAFSATATGARIDLEQVDVPDHLLDVVHDSWEPRYFTPLRQYLQQHP